MVSDVDSCGQRLPLKGLRKVTILYVFSLLLLLQTADIKNKEKNSSDWSEKTVKCQAVIKRQTCFLLKKDTGRGKSLTFRQVSRSHSSHHVRYSALALYKAYTFPSDSNL